MIENIGGTPREWGAGGVFDLASLKDLSDSICDPLVRRSMDETERLSNEIAELPESDQIQLIQLADEELWGAFIGTTVRVTGRAVQYNGETGGAYIQDVVCGVSEVVYLEDRPLQFNGCVVQREGDKAAVVLSGFESALDDDGEVQTVLYGIPLDTMLDFQEVWSAERTHAALRTCVPNFMDDLDAAVLGLEHVDAASAAMALKNISMDDLALYGNIDDLSRVLLNLNAYLNHLIQFDKYMPYIINYTGTCCIDGNWCEAVMRGVPIAEVAVRVMTIQCADQPEQPEILFVLEGTALDPRGDDNMQIVLPIDQLEYLRSMRTEYFA